MSTGVEDGWWLENTNHPLMLIDNLLSTENPDDIARPAPPVELCALASSERLRWVFPWDTQGAGFLKVLAAQ